MKGKPLLLVKDLVVEVGGKVVVRGVSLELGRAEIAVLTGPNGSGKSSLTNALLGNENYLVKAGEIRLEDKQLTEKKVDERACAGLLVLFQNPVVVPGVKVFNLAKSAYESMKGEVGEVVKFKRKLEQLCGEVGLPAEYVGREVNEGFSGGEKKRLEMLQLLLLRPKIAVLDEVDSGLDIEGREMVARVVGKMRKEGTAFLVISHYEEMIRELKFDKQWEMRNGRLQAR